MLSRQLDGGAKADPTFETLIGYDPYPKTSPIGTVMKRWTTGIKWLTKKTAARDSQGLRLGPSSNHDGPFRVSGRLNGSLSSCFRLPRRT